MPELNYDLLDINPDTGKLGLVWDGTAKDITGANVPYENTIVTTENLSLIEKLVQIGVTIQDMSSIVTDSNGDIITSGA